ncbi:lipopolysaccharide-modifying protein [Poronia punctata]|nr:lipopolysaccharide-modifying protein [Poronia punctata]
MLLLLPSRAHLFKYGVFSTFITLLLLYLILYRSLPELPSGIGWKTNDRIITTTATTSTNNHNKPKPKIDNDNDNDNDNHPITKLIENAQKDFSATLAKRSYGLPEAAARYRERRGRHPPPGFDKWFEAAEDGGAIVVEDFFDRIYHDLNPYWGVDADEMRHRARVAAHGVIRVRGGKIVRFAGDNENVFRGDRLDLWEGLLKDMLQHLPDLDMPVNLLDEPRMMVPWEEISGYVAKGQKSRRLRPAEEMGSEQTDHDDADANPNPFDPAYGGDGRHVWNHLFRACPPDTPGRQAQALVTMDGSIDEVFPEAPTTTTNRSYMTKEGFVANFTAAKDPCLQPHLRGMHGTFVEPFSMATTSSLFPLFGGSKLPTNNELLIPAAMYLSTQARYTGGSSLGGKWSDKKDGLLWRGVASGGRNQEDNWWHYHRHRFVQMLNGSAVEAVEKGDEAAGPTFNLVAASTYNYSSIPRPLAAKREEGRGGGGLGAWLKGFSDVGFNRLECSPERKDWLGRLRPDCPYTDPFFAIADSKPMTSMYDYKFLPDVDGNSYSARWRPFLLSTSCPLKATVYVEWHDDRLFPWLHFVPFDNTFMDIYAVLDYFLDGRDHRAQRIAMEGSEWADKVMRREDMMLYTWRLLLEYARVLDPARDGLGFVGDLL